jgi:hypothetical protein
VSACNICHLPVSMKKSGRARLRRPDGGYDHTYCALGMPSMDFQKLDASGKSNRKAAPKGDTGDGWVFVQPLSGGWLVRCGLCGDRVKRFFMAANTNHAEALRLATAFEARHRLSAMHSAAQAAFHADVAPEVETKEEMLLRAIFGMTPLTERERRKRSAARAALEAERNGGGVVDS